MTIAAQKEFEEVSSKFNNFLATLPQTQHAILSYILGLPSSGQKIVVGGADGILVTIDEDGHIHITRPEGPLGPLAKTIRDRSRLLVIGPERRR